MFSVKGNIKHAFVEIRLNAKSQRKNQGYMLTNVDKTEPKNEMHTTASTL